MWSGAERNTAEQRGTPRNRRGRVAVEGGDLAAKARGGRRTNQSCAPRSAEVKHRTVPVLAINSPIRISPLSPIELG